MSEFTNELGWTLDALRGDYGWALCATTWRAVLSLSLGFVSNKLKTVMESAVPEDREWISRLLENKWYRRFWLLFRTLTSVQLPTECRKPSGGTAPPFPKPEPPKE